MTLEEAKMTVYANCIYACEKAGFDLSTICMVDDALRTIIEIADRKTELKRGRWIPHKQDDGKTILWKCSECGQVIYSETETDRFEFHKWCSRCGADMRGE